MAVRKEIIVLSGGGHKGVVKISGVAGRENIAKVSCALDFRPAGAMLYLIGKNIARIKLYDINCEVEVPFCANDDTGCVIRSSSLTMFGGRGAKSMMLKKIEEYGKSRTLYEENSTADRVNSTSVTGFSAADISSNERAMVNNKEIMSETAAANCTEGNVINCETNINSDDGKEAVAEVTGGNLQEKTDLQNDKEAAKEAKLRVEASVKSDIKPLGEWTKYDGNNFYYAVKPQIDEMFICYPEEKLLSDSVPNSKWVRVDAEDGHYVVGLLFDEDEPSFICYGVPQLAARDKNARCAPEELEGMCVWLPMNDVGGAIDGYWMIYQSAKTGEIIK